jgi:TIR domain
MIDVLEQAIEKVRALPADRQMYAAEILEDIDSGGGQGINEDERVADREHRRRRPGRICQRGGSAGRPGPLSLMWVRPGHSIIEDGSMPSRFDEFLSYASEDRKLADSLYEGLAAQGFSIWFAPHQLETGQDLTTAVNYGMERCFYGIALITDTYLSKNWTRHELETFQRGTIERRKQLLPILCGVPKDALEQGVPSLLNLIAADWSAGPIDVMNRLSKVLAKGAPTVARIPVWEHPVSLFLKGRGEVNLGKKGAASVFEIVIHSQAAEFPVFLDGTLYSRRHLLWNAMCALYFGTNTYQVFGDHNECIKKLFHEEFSECLVILICI